MKNKAASTPERPAAFWNKIYVAVVITTIIVIAALWGFSSYFNG